MRGGGFEILDYRLTLNSICGQIPFTSLQFPLYEFLKQQLSIWLHWKPLYTHEAATCGSIAGGTAAALTTPLDVLKTRVMLDLRVRAISSISRSGLLIHDAIQDPSKHKLPSLPARFKQIYISEGVRALFAGVVPRTMWISAGGAVFLGVYDWAVHGLMGW